MTKNLEKFYNDLGQRESSGNYTAVNKAGYVGKYLKNEKEIFAQMNSVGMPTENDLKNAAQSSGGVVHVNSYTRSDGVEVKSY